MHFYAYHGVLPQERTVGNEYCVDLTLFYPFEAALHSDGLSDTINYAEVYETVKSEMAIPSDLLEHVAGRIIRALQARFPKITGGKIAVTKKRPPIAAEIDEVSAIVEG